MDTPVAVGSQLGDDRLDLRHEFTVWQRRPADPRGGPITFTAQQLSGVIALFVINLPIEWQGRSRPLLRGRSRH